MGGAEADSLTTEVQGETMSMTKKNIIEVPVETVDKWSRMLDYCSSTIMFWKLDNKWPTNLIYDGLTDTLNEIKQFLPTRSNFDTELF